YRLEMGTDLKTGRGNNLYDFWGSSLAESVNAGLRKTDSRTLVNLASKEYFSSLPESELDGEIITPHFKDLKNGSYRFLSFYAKKARGMMCDFVVQNRIENPEDLKGFNREGYRYNKDLSAGSDLVFTRDKPPVAA
ncbi:MAG: peroxide stress protein YaaA, partial [Verrucomicrobiota bacterium]